MRPLYVHRSAEVTAFASEPRQLLGRGLCTAALDETVVSDYLHVARRLDPGSSFYRDLQLVRPGHAVIASATSFTQRRYWQWREPTELRYAKREDYVEHMRAELERAVRVRVRGCRPVGIMLSGGLDSSSIAGFAAPACDVRAYSMVFDEHPDCDEREFIAPMVDQLGLQWKSLHPEQATLFSDVPRVDEPDASLAAEPWWQPAMTDLSGAGGRVMLVGDGGDTLMLSESDWHFVDWAVRGRVRPLARELRGYVRRWGALPRLRLRSLIGRAAPGWLRTRAPATWSGTPRSWLDASDGAWRNRVARHRARIPPVTFKSFARQFAFDAVTSDRGTGMGWWPASAHQANRYGLTYAYPLMDRRLQSFVYSVPLEMFFRDGADRALVRDAVTGLIPDAVSQRSSQTVFGSWFSDVARSPELRNVIESTPWPELPGIPGRAQALRAAASGNAPAWQVIALAQFVRWYSERGA